MVSTRRAFLREGSGTLAALGLSSLSGCVGVIGGGDGKKIKAASMTWAEARLLGYMAYEILREKTDLTVIDDMALGGSMQCFEAVKHGEVDFYHLYTGGAWTTIPPKHDHVPKDPKTLYKKVKKEMKSRHDLRYLQRGLYDDTYALAARPKWANRTGIETISDFADYISEGHTDFTVVLGTEFAERPDGWPGMAKAYGFDDARDELTTKKVGASLTYQVLGHGKADVGMVYTTNPQIKKYDLQVLEDDRNFFPPYNPAPLVNGKTVRKYPQIVEPLNSVMRTLKSTEQILKLNAKVAIEGKEAQTVAQNYLGREGLI